MEEFLDAGDGAPPPDYEFWCVHGTVRFIQVDVDRFADHRREPFTRDGVSLTAAILYPRPDFPPKRPDNLDELIGVAEALSAPIDFVRVDLYALEDSVRFGELTNFPEGGRGRMEPIEAFAELAADWRRHLDVGPSLFRRLRSLS